MLYKHRKGKSATFRGSSLSRNKPNKQATQKTSQTEKNSSQLNDEKQLQQETATLFQSQTDLLEVENATIADTPRQRIFSSRTKRKCGDKAYAFMYTQRNATVNFLTLTFINNVTDKQAQQCLNKFLTMLRKTFGDFNYLWVAERQDGKRNEFEHCTNNLHFHIIVDKFIPIKKFNNLWVLQQYNSGILHPKYDYSTISKQYENETLQELLNPVDIKPVKSLKTAAHYITKYITKNDSAVECLVWHCSRGVSRLATAQTQQYEVFEEAIQDDLNSYKSKKTLKVITPQIHEIFDIKGDLIAMTVNVNNKDYFHKKHLILLNTVNAFFLNLDKTLKPSFFTYNDDLIYGLN